MSSGLSSHLAPAMTPAGSCTNSGRSSSLLIRGSRAEVAPVFPLATGLSSTGRRDSRPLGLQRAQVLCSSAKQTNKPSELSPGCSPARSPRWRHSSRAEAQPLCNSSCRPARVTCAPRPGEACELPGEASQSARCSPRQSMSVNTSRLQMNAIRCAKLRPPHAHLSGRHGRSHCVIIEI